MMLCLRISTRLETVLQRTRGCIFNDDSYDGGSLSKVQNLLEWIIKASTMNNLRSSLTYTILQRFKVAENYLKILSIGGEEINR